MRQRKRAEGREEKEKQEDTREDKKRQSVNVKEEGRRGEGGEGRYPDVCLYSG